MRKRFKDVRRKLHNFIERMKMSDGEYLTMKEQSDKYKGMMSACEFQVNDPEYIDVKDSSGNVLHRFTKSRSASLNVNIEDMLRNGGIIYDKKRVSLNVK